MTRAVLRADDRPPARSWPPPPGEVDLGDLAGTEPVSRRFGGDRGTPLDRWYIERFLLANADAIRGRCGEIGESTYTHRFGGAAVGTADIIDQPEVDNPVATVRVDLQRGDGLAEGAFDCLILSQTLHMIYEVGEALATVHRALAPGGTLLATVPGITSIDSEDGPEKWFWPMTQSAARRLVAERFGADAVRVAQYGNVYAATAFLQGLALEELDRDRLAVVDPLYPVIVGIRATRR